MSEVASDNSELQSPDSQGQGSGVPVWVMPTLLLLAVAAGLIGLQVVGSVQRLFFPEPHGQLGDPPWWLELRRIAMMKNDAIGFAATGGLLFAVLGGALGIIGSVGRMVIGVVAGGVCGALVGAAVGAGAYYIQDSTQQAMMDPLVRTAAVWGLPFASFGLLGGLLAVFIVPARSLGGGVLSGIIAAVLLLVGYIAISAGLFPLGHPELVYEVEDGDTRVRYAAYCGLALAGAVAAILALRQGGKSQEA